MGMIDISEKDVTKREAVACGRIFLKPAVIIAIKKKTIPKGDCIEAARLAGIMAAKRTPLLIPLCHPIAVEYIGIDFSFNKDNIKITTTVAGHAKTGFEMEALTATAVSALTIYDMCKPMDRDIVISEIRLLKKSGGKSGVYVRE